MPQQLPFDRDGIFAPDLARQMSDIFEECCAILALGDYPCLKEALASRIVALVQDGERDPQQLRCAALRLSWLDHDDSESAASRVVV